MYVRPNYKTKKALREAITAGERVEVFSPGPFPAPTQGTVTIEGPHYPQAHTWYARVSVTDGRVTRLLS